jgi:phosphatidylglycerol:prolipoprotein diacylglycerol transferase
MITIGIDPIAFHIGTTAIGVSTLAIGAGGILFFFVSLHEAKRLRLPIKYFYNGIVWMAVGAFILSRLPDVVANWSRYLAHPEHIIGSQSWGIYGAIAGATLAILFYVRIKKISFWKAVDVAAPGAIAGIAVARVGCFITGCCYGVPTSVPWSVMYTNPDSLALLNTPIHPTQLYYVLWGIAMFAILWTLRRRLPVYGSLAMLFVILFAAGDFFIRLTRAGEAVWLGMQAEQLVSLALLVIAIPWFAAKVRRVS